MSIRTLSVAFVTVLLAVGALTAGTTAQTTVQDSVSGYHQRIDRATEL